MDKKIIAIDFDGVIHDHKNPVKGRRMGPPMVGAKESLEKLKASYKIIVHSVWGGEPKVIKDWMDYYQIPFDEITNVKPNADIYLDDRAVRFSSWEEFNEKFWL